MLFNTLVHVLMYYFYFACSVPALRKRLWWKKYLTKLQILQFVVALTMAVCLWRVHRQSVAGGGPGCAGHNAFVVSTGFNATLLLLFVDFHVRSYGAKKAGAKKPVEQECVAVASSSSSSSNATPKKKGD